MSSFFELSSFIEDQDLSDPLSREQVRAFLGRLRAQVRAESRSFLSEFLDATDHLIRLTDRLDVNAAVDYQRALAFLVQVVGHSVDQRQRADSEFVSIPDVHRPYQELTETNDVLLGEILAELGLLSPEQIELAREAQSSSGMLLGEVLVHSGVIQPEDLTMALNLQKHVSRVTLSNVRKGGGVDEWSLGQILLAKRKIDEATLEQGLELQRLSDCKLGRALVELGAVTWDDVNEAVKVQKSRR